MKTSEKWSIESTIGLIAIIIIACIFAAVLGIIGLISYTAMSPAPEQTIIQQVETTGDVRRLCIEAKTNGRIDAMSCDVIDPMSGGIK